MDLRTELRIRFASAAHAEYAVKALSVDAEFNAERSFKELSVQQDTLVATVSAVDVRMLRVAVSAFLDMLGVVLRTLREFA